MESDPSGLHGNINIYAYVANNPVLWLDFYGLHLSASQIANIIFNETRSLSGPSVQQARNDIAHAIINGDEKKGVNRPLTAPDTAKVPPAGVDTYQKCLNAAMSAQDQNLADTDPTDGAMHYNLTNGRSKGSFFGYPLETQAGPLNNSFPTHAVGPSNVYVNTYGN